MYEKVDIVSLLAKVIAPILVIVAVGRSQSLLKDISSSEKKSFSYERNESYRFYTARWFIVFMVILMLFGCLFIYMMSFFKEDSEYAFWCMTAFGFLLFLLPPFIDLSTLRGSFIEINQTKVSLHGRFKKFEINLNQIDSINRDNRGIMIHLVNGKSKMIPIKFENESRVFRCLEFFINS
ncbi:hypothetical protein [Cerasicoccus maritimus]|uniref:hypothetical protein n=1 Tax=Cerasicoccus maritimus TaxID=490089 RepID=UPI0028524D28|nr:hypothetical protein [Cerasicoccus maritimus]